MRFSKGVALVTCSAFLLTSCAAKFDMAELQGTCRGSTSSFGDYGNCLKASLHHGNTPPKNARLREFFAEIDRLTAAVEADRMNIDTAHYTLERTRQRLRAEEEQENERTAAILIGAALVGAAAYAASKGGGGGGGYGAAADEEGYAWDQMDAPGGGYQWRCRDKSNGRFAYDYQCAGEIKVDSTWPGK
jgi:hypothetical protein